MWLLHALLLHLNVDWGTYKLHVTDNSQIIYLPLAKIMINDTNCRKIREKDISKYHIQLCFALLCMFLLTLILVSLSAEKVTAIHGGCVSLSLLVHYFILVSVMWMGAEALLMFQKIVIIFVQITAKCVSVICWSECGF